MQLELQGSLCQAAAEVDWQSTATLLLERMRRPAFVLARDATVVVVNRELVKLAGRERSEFVGEPVERAFSAPRSANWQLELVFTGAIREFECSTLNAAGEQLVFSGELAVVGSGRGACVLAISSTHRVVQARRLGTRYTVRRDGQRARLLRVFGADGVVHELDGSCTCHEYLHGRAQPCSGCPLFTAGGDCDATAVPPPNDDGDSRIVTTRELDGATEVTAIQISKDLVSDLLQARIDAMARAAELTERERTILSYVLLARSADEIAGDLGVSARTVKFHLANLLNKIGAESRMDLFRLIL